MSRKRVVITEKDARAIKDLTQEHGTEETNFFESQQFLNILSLAGMELAEEKYDCGANRRKILRYKKSKMPVTVENLKFTDFEEI